MARYSSSQKPLHVPQRARPRLLYDPFESSAPVGTSLEPIQEAHIRVNEAESDGKKHNKKPGEKTGPAGQMCEVDTDKTKNEWKRKGTRRTKIAKVSTCHFVSCKSYQPGSFGEELLQEKASLVGEMGSNIHPAWFYICWHHIHYPQA
ncbi:unnamed protein product [Arctogadus glacialis]